MSFFKSLGHLLFGKKEKQQQISRFTPEQSAALSQLLRQGLSDTDVSGLEKRYKGLFEQDVAPGLAEKFTSMGEGQRSSAFEESLRRGGLDLAEQLAGLRQQSGMQKLGLGLQPQFDTMIRPGQPGLLQTLAPALMGAAFSGPLGGMTALGASGIGDRYAKSRYAKGQPEGLKSSFNPVLMKILEGIQL